jgi:hypothetical protein
VNTSLPKCSPLIGGKVPNSANQGSFSNDRIGAIYSSMGLDTGTHCGELVALFSVLAITLYRGKQQWNPFKKTPRQMIAEIFHQQQEGEFTHDVVLLAGENSLASKDQSIISVAWPNSVSGTVMSSARAVLRLITNSISVGCSIASWPGSAPLRIRST